MQAEVLRIWQPEKSNKMISHDAGDCALPVAPVDDYSDLSSSIQAHVEDFSDPNSSIQANSLRVSATLRVQVVIVIGCCGGATTTNDWVIWPVDGGAATTLLILWLHLLAELIVLGKICDGH